MARGGEGRRWLGYGCFGCLAIAGGLVLVAGGLAGVALLQVRSEDVQDRVLSPDLPATDDPTPETPIPAEPGALAEGQPGRVVLELAHGEFEVRPARPGEGLRVEATYDLGTYALEESLDAEESARWVYRVRFDRTASGLITTLKEAFGGTRPKVRVYLPLDVPFGLEGRMSSGAARIELGGLWLTTADLDLDKGGFEVSVSDPLREPAESLTLRTRMGGCSTSRLGNASPRRMQLDYSMGGVQLDLRGDWKQDADVTITGNMGGGVVRLPRDVVLRGLENWIDVSTTAPPDAEGRPTLDFSVSAKKDQIEFID